MKRFLLSIFLLFGLLVSAEAASRFAVCTTACTWDNSSTAMWSASSGGATGQSAPTSSDDVTLDGSTCVGGVTCTITVNADLLVRTLTMGACTASTNGCILDFSVNNNNITFANASPALSLTGTGTRKLKMGNGNWTFAQSSGTMITALTSTGMTITAGNSTIITNHTNNFATAVTFHTGAGQTWGNITINGNISKGELKIVDSNTTFNNFTVNGPNYLDFNGSGTITVSTLTALGGPSTSISYNSPQWNMTSGAVSALWNWFYNGTCGGGATFLFASSFMDASSSSGCSVTAPSVGGGGHIIGG